MIDWTTDLPEFDATALRPFFDDSASQAASASKRLPAPRKIIRNTERRRFVQLTQTAECGRHLERLPVPGESLHSTMSGSFHGWSLVPAVLELAGCGIVALDVSTLGFSRENAESLFSMLDDGQILATTFLVSSYFRSVDRDVFGFLHHGLTSRGHPCAVRRTHAKVLVFALADERQIVIESSSNLRSCRNVEVFTMYQDDQLADFHRGWMQRLIAEGSDK